MYRTLMQVYVKGSIEAVDTYQKAFNAKVLAVYPNEKGGYIHSEIDAYGQIIAVSEAEEESVIGTTMQFCFHFGEGGAEEVHQAYEVLKEGAKIIADIGPCDFSPCMCALVDKFGVYWCLFE